MFILLSNVNYFILFLFSFLKYPTIYPPSNYFIQLSSSTCNILDKFHKIRHNFTTWLNIEWTCNTPAAYSNEHLHIAMEWKFKFIKDNIFY